MYQVITQPAIYIPTSFGIPMVICPAFVIQDFTINFS